MQGTPCLKQERPARHGHLERLGKVSKKQGLLGAGGIYTASVTVNSTGDDNAGPSSSVRQFLRLLERRWLSELVVDNKALLPAFDELPLLWDLGYMRCEHMWLATVSRSHAANFWV